jgi:hypothetical protein
LGSLNIAMNVVDVWQTLVRAQVIACVRHGTAAEDLTCGAKYFLLTSASRIALRQ